MVAVLTILTIAWPTVASVVVIVLVLLGLLLLLRAEGAGPPSTRRRLPRV